ncbi:Ras-specific guanine nucleotide-releasing factor 1, partial [Melipona quadrifasciata]
TSTAATAFAIATSASNNPPDKGSDQDNRSGSCRDKNRRNEPVMSTAIMTRVLKILRHWISKHPQDFESDHRLKNLTIKFLDDIIHWPNLLPAEHKAATQLLRLITKEQPENNKEELRKLLAPPTIAHVIQEIRQLQQSSYNIEPIEKIINYLLDPSLQIDDDTLYQMSLEIEPRSSKPSSSLFHLTSSVAHKSKK